MPVWWITDLFIVMVQPRVLLSVVCDILTASGRCIFSWMNFKSWLIPRYIYICIIWNDLVTDASFLLARAPQRFLQCEKSRYSRASFKLHEPETSITLYQVQDEEEPWCKLLFIIHLLSMFSFWYDRTLSFIVTVNISHWKVYSRVWTWQHMIWALTRLTCM